jgi:hypothetical protein
MKMVGYGRCSTAEQASNGVSIEVQRRAVERVAKSNGWDLTWLADEGVSGGVPPECRKRFRAALALLDVGEVGALIFTKVDRASRCTEDFARLIRLSEEQGRRLIVTEMGIDSRTPMGKAMAHMAGSSRSLSATSSGCVPARRSGSRRRTASRSADQDRRQTTWWPAFCGAHGGQDGVRDCPRPEQRRCADCAGCARLVASYAELRTDWRRVQLWAYRSAARSTSTAPP